MRRYGAILADPPWWLSGGKNGKKGWSKSASPDAHYRLLRTRDIAALPVGDLAKDDSHLWLWTPNCMLRDALEVMEAWGFRYSNNVAWVKTGGIGLGQRVRTTHELCLLGLRGRTPYARTDAGGRIQILSSFSAPRRGHSQKPDEMRQKIRMVSPGPYLELFARERAPGWSAWGDEVEGDIRMPSVVG